MLVRSLRLPRTVDDTSQAGDLGAASDILARGLSCQERAGGTSITVSLGPTRRLSPIMMSGFGCPCGAGRWMSDVAVGQVRCRWRFAMSGSMVAPMSGQ